MTFRQMELFLAVCEHKSINKASESYFISQQGISKMIKELEQELGCKLLYRTSSGVIPTKYGTYFLNECRTMLEKKSYIYSHITQVKDFPEETIFLGMAFGVISAIPYKIIMDFEKEHPYVNIEYSDHIDMHLENLMKKGEYDFCITTGVLDEDVFTCERLLKESVYLCIPKSNALYHFETITMDDLKTQLFSMFSTQFHIRHNFVASCRKSGFDPKIVVTSNDFNSLTEIAKSNGLLFVVPEHTITQENRNFRYYPFPDSSFCWEVYFAKKKNKLLTENMIAFYHHLKKCIAEVE